MRQSIETHTDDDADRYVTLTGQLKLPTSHHMFYFSRLLKYTHSKRGGELRRGGSTQ